MWVRAHVLRRPLFICAFGVCACSGSATDDGSSSSAGAPSSGSTSGGASAAGANNGGASTSNAGAATGGASTSDAGAATGGASTSGAGASAANGGALGSAGTSSAAGSSATAACGSPLEKMVGGLCVANSVAIDAGYSIDATEVTRGQYASWLATKPALPSASDPNCGWNTSYELDPTCWDASPEKGVTDGDEHPVVCANWCDAFAYCAGVGKRLCGKIGGGTNAPADLANANASEWYRACSSDGADAYPYGQTYSSAACDTYDHPSSTSPHTSLVVGSLSTCQSSVPGYQGVFDMAGNAYEWDDSCSGPGAAEYCQIRGGSIVGQSNCAYNIESARNTTFDDIGFRCCTN